eukprot:11576129-Alexandrium_andersonii.AAC.1
MDLLKGGFLSWATREDMLYYFHGFALEPSIALSGTIVLFVDASALPGHSPALPAPESDLWPVLVAKGLVVEQPDSLGQGWQLSRAAVSALRCAQ